MGLALAVVVLVLMIAVCVSHVRDPNSTFSRLFIPFWPRPLEPGQERFIRVLGAVALVITCTVAIALTIDGIDRLLSS